MSAIYCNASARFLAASSAALSVPPFPLVPPLPPVPVVSVVPPVPPLTAALYSCTASAFPLHTSPIARSLASCSSAPAPEKPPPMKPIIRRIVSAIFTSQPSAVLNHTCAFVVKVSNEPPVMSKACDMALFSSVSLAISSSFSLPSSPVCDFTSSRLVLMSFSERTSASPASAPFLPNTSFNVSPTTCALPGNSDNLAATSCTMSNVFLAPVCKSFSTCLLDMPILSSASFVWSDNSRMRVLAILIASSPLSVNMPLRVCVSMATNWLADSPASLKYCG